MDLRSTGKYANCASMKETHFEGICSSSWAITVATVASDELCATVSAVNASHPDLQFRFSYQELIECCSDCYKGYDNGCFGGDFREALRYLQQNGLPTGSSYIGSSSLCSNYKQKECYMNPELFGTDTSLMCTDDSFDFTKVASRCSPTCANNAQVLKTNVRKLNSFKQIQKGTSNYANDMSDEVSKNMKIVITEMTVYEDLYAYKSNEIYMHLYGRSVGSVVVAIVGVGNDANTKQDFWIVRLPWGSKFGNNGHIKMQKGTNNCGIENPGSAYSLSFTPPTA